jgi:hypothetical protein
MASTATASRRPGSGEPLEVVLQTSDVELTSGSRSFASGFRPLCDARRGLQADGRQGVKDWAGGPRTWKDAAGVSPRTGLVPARASGRYHRFEVTIPASQKWTAVYGVDPEGHPEGQQ